MRLAPNGCDLHPAKRRDCSLLSRYFTAVTGCDSHPWMRLAMDQSNDPEFTTRQSRLECDSHTSVRILDLKGEHNSFFISLSSTFHFRTPLSELVQRADSANFHLFSLLERYSGCSESLFFIRVDDYAYFTKIWRQKIGRSEISAEKCFLRVFLLFYYSFLVYLWSLFVERCL